MAPVEAVRVFRGVGYLEATGYIPAGSAAEREAPTTRFKCKECGKLTAGRLPREGRHGPGDGSMRYPRRHKVNGGDCPGNIEPAEWVDIDQQGVEL